MFKVGDKVRILLGAPYSITKPNSLGTILEITPYHDYIVIFDYLEGGQYGYYGETNKIDTFRIESEWLELHQTLTKEQQVCNKINMMYKRQQERACTT